MTYKPKVNDYVIWERHGLKDEGWVYFVSQETEDKRGFTKTHRYLTIETGIRQKPECQYDKNNPHKYVHILLCCYESQWHELRYCLLYTSPSPRDVEESRMPSSA